MDQPLRLIVSTPGPHGVQDRLQAVAGLREGIFHSQQHRRIGLTGEQSLLLDVLELDGQYLLGNRTGELFQLVKAPQNDT